MTRDEILAMEPGRELDALVAEKVMEYTVHGQFRDKDGVRVMIDRYSTDIAAAWEVVKKLLEKGDEMMGPDIFCYKNQTVVIIRRSAIKVHAKTAPEAICKAALLAVMEG